MRIQLLLAALLLTDRVGAQTVPAPSSDRFALKDVFELQWVADPQISPDGSKIVFSRFGFDIMTDEPRGALWTVNADGSNPRALLAPGRSASSPRWAPDGSRLAFLSTVDRKSQIAVRWMDTGQEAVLTHLDRGPTGIAWSPDGRWIAFSMFVPEPPKPFITLPEKPEGAQWAPPIRFIDQLNYRADGAGYLEPGHQHLFVVAADGGTPRQLTNGAFDDGPPRWVPDGSAIVFSGNRHEGGEYDPNDTEVYEVSLATGAITALTNRHGPDGDPAVSPDGRQIAYTGYDERMQGYQVTRLYLMNRDGSGSRLLSGKLDRDVGNLRWSGDGKGVYFQYDDRGDTKIGYLSTAGELKEVASGVGGLDLGRPYSGGTYSLATTGRVAFTLTAPDHPADLAVAAIGQPEQRLTRLNDGLFSQRALGSVEEIWWPSSFDQRRVQGWIIKPPHFDPAKKYPLVLEIHGGPFANYGVRFTAELQLYAAAGNVVLYTNPRGSTSYGEEFGNLIHHDYPDHDYDDLMSGVDAVIAKGSIDDHNLFVTGGSGGGVLTAWIVGHTNRFRAAVVAKPVINWYSFVLTSDGLAFYHRYWFPGPPWEHLEQYMKRSPISYVGNITTPTMLLQGEEDYRTPIEESEQLYGALKIRKVPTALVRIPGASHEISERPSHLIAKVASILEWFNRYRSPNG